MSNDIFSDDDLETGKLSDLLKNKTQLKEFLGYENLSNMEKEINYLEEILNFDFKTSFYDEGSAKYKIPLISFEIFKVLLSTKVKKNYLNYQENMDTSLLLEETKKNLSDATTIFQRIIYRFILNKWEFILNGDISFDDWRKRVAKLDNQLKKESGKLNNESQIDSQIKKNYLKKFWQVKNNSSMFDRYGSCTDDSAKEYFSKELTRFDLLDLLTLCASNQLTIDISYLKESTAHTFFEWLKWIVLDEAKLMERYISEINGGFYNKKRQLVHFLELFTYYTPVIMIANQNQFLINTEISTEDRKMYKCKLAFEGENKIRLGTNTGLKLIDFLSICQSEGIENEGNELIKGINLVEVNFQTALCKDYFPLQDLCEFFHVHKIVYPPYTDQVILGTYKGIDNRRKRLCFDKQLKYYFSELPDAKKILVSKRLSIERSKMNDYLSELSSSFLIGNFSEEEIRAKLEQESDEIKRVLKKKKDIFSDRYDKCRLGLYLLDLAVDDSVAEYEKKLDPIVRFSEMNYQVIRKWNSKLQMIDQKLESGKHLVEIVREMRSR